MRAAVSFRQPAVVSPDLCAGSGFEKGIAGSETIKQQNAARNRKPAAEGEFPALCFFTRYQMQENRMILLGGSPLAISEAAA